MIYQLYSQKRWLLPCETFAAEGLQVEIGVSGTHARYTRHKATGPRAAPTLLQLTCLLTRAHRAGAEPRTPLQPPLPLRISPPAIPFRVFKNSSEWLWKQNNRPGSNEVLFFSPPGSHQRSNVSLLLPHPPSDAPGTDREANLVV